MKVFGDERIHGRSRKIGGEEEEISEKSKRENQEVKTSFLQDIFNDVAFRYRNDLYSNIIIDDRVKDIYEEVKNILSDPSNYLEIKLQKNQTMIIDNYCVLHGRNSFLPENYREYNRINFMGDGELEDKLSFGVVVSNIG